MLKNLIFIIILLFLGISEPSGILYAQKLNIQVKSCNQGTIFIKAVEGEKLRLVDSCLADQFCNFIFSLSKHHAGLYNLQLNKQLLNVVIDSVEDIAFKTSVTSINDSLNIIKSESNKLYYSFLKLNKQYKTKVELLQLILARYSKDDEYYKTTQQKMNEIQSEYITFINITSQKNPQSFVARYIRTSQLPIADFTIPLEQTLPYLKSHALDYVDFKDDGLIYSDAFTNKTIEYLTYYRNPQLPKELLEKEFMVAVDTLLNKARVNSIVYQHLVEYLIDGFKKFGFDTILDYIVENYVIKDDLCLDVKTEGLIKKRIDQAKYLHVGNVVPDISLPDSTGKMINLRDIAAEKILIIFYASWCPHCQTLLPQIRDLYNMQGSKRFEVLAISLDTSRTDWINFIRNNSLNWLNVCDLEGWDGKASLDYFLYATPSMFLIDKERKVISKPMSYDELVLK